MKKHHDHYFVHLFNDFSGSPRVLKDFISQDIGSGDKKHLITSKHAGFLDQVDAGRSELFYLRSQNRWVQLVYFLLSQLHLFVLMLWLLGRSKWRGRSATVVVNTLLPFGAYLPARLLATETIAYIHESYIKPRLLKDFLRFFVNHFADRVIFVSRYLRQAEGFKKPRQSVIYNGLSSDFEQHAATLDLAQKFAAKQILLVGSLKDYKGLAQFVMLAQSAQCKHYRFVAALNADDNEIRRYFCRFELPDNLRLLSRPDNLPMLYAESFLVVNFTLVDQCVETFGLTLLEGMHFGCPVIAPPEGGPTEFVSPDNGALIDSRNTGAVIDFVQHLADSFTVWQGFSTMALETAKTFSQQNYRNAVNRYMQSG